MILCTFYVHVDSLFRDSLRTHDKESYITNNSFVVTAIKHNFKLPYIHQLLVHTDFKKICTGSAQPQLTNNSISQLVLLIPDDNLIITFCDYLNNFYNKIELMITNIKILTESRDRLLPKLMSGEVEV